MLDRFGVGFVGEVVMNQGAGMALLIGAATYVIAVYGFHAGQATALWVAAAVVLVVGLG